MRIAVLIFFSFFFCLANSHAQQKKDTVNVVFHADSVLIQFMEVHQQRNVIHKMTIQHHYSNTERQIKRLTFSKIAPGIAIGYIDVKKIKDKLLTPKQFLNLFRNKYGVLDPYLPEKKYVINIYIKSRGSRKYQVYNDYQLSTDDFYGNEDLIMLLWN